MIDYVGQQLGNYRLLRLVGRGGFAQVYLGEHVYLKTQAAIKVLDMQLGEDERGDFQREARTIAHLVHPHIVRVLDFGVEDITPFLVMDYAPNGSLRQRYPKGTRMPPNEIVAYVKEVAQALQFAHEHNLVHRDIKPGNLLLGRENQVLLSDFGIALIAQNSYSQSTEETMIGTAAYMAPEQIQGKPRPASDQYSLGIVVYEWLSGERPFRGSIAEIISQQMTAPPPPLHARIPAISSDVEEAVMVALAKDPNERFANVTAFAYALEQAIQAPSPANQQPLTLQPIITPPVQPTLTNMPTPPPPAPLIAGAQMMLPPLPAMHAEQRGQRPSMPVNGRLPASREVPRTRKAHPLLRGVLAGIVGTLLFGGLILLTEYTGAYLNVPLFSTLTLALVIGSLANVIVPFFGAVYGSFVGLCSGLLGMLLANYAGSYMLPAQSQHPLHNWAWYAGSAALGLLSGLVAHSALKRRRSFGIILLVDIFAAVGVDLGFTRLLGGQELLLAIALTVVLLHLSLTIYARRAIAREAPVAAPPLHRNADVY